MSRRKRAALVGTGLIARKKHIPAFLRHRRVVELVAVCDVNAENARLVAREFGIPAAYAQIGEMLAREKPDVVDICTPPRTHATLAVQAMEQGCHVLIEKPMATTMKECDAIVAATREHAVKACVVHSDLFYRPFLAARDLIRQGAIGTFRGMRIFLSTPTDYMTSVKDHWAHKLPGGVFGESGPHAVYMSLAFLDAVREVSVNAVRLLDYPWSAFEDYRIELIADNGISSITLAYTTNQWMARLEILGDAGVLALDLEGMSLIRHRRPDLSPTSVGLSVLSEAGQMLGCLVGNAARFVARRLQSPHEVILDRFIRSIGEGSEPPVTAQEGREAVRVMSMIAERLEARSAGAHVRGGVTGAHPGH